MLAEVADAADCAAEVAALEADTEASPDFVVAVAALAAAFVSEVAALLAEVDASEDLVVAVDAEAFQYACIQTA